MYHGDIALGSTIDIKFTTRQFSTGAPFTLGGTPAVSAYIDNSVTQITAGITLSVDFDSVTGLNNVRVVATSGNGYSAASNVQLVITTGTVDSVSVVGEVIGSFSIDNRSALQPTTAGRTLDVSATGEAGIDWANVGSPTTTVGLSGTTVKTATDVETDTADIQSRIPAALTGDGNIKADALYIGGTLQTGVDHGDIPYTGIIRANTATGGGGLTITLDASASATSDLYKDEAIWVYSGTGAGQVRTISSYDGGTKVATVSEAWTTAPTSGSLFAIIATHIHSVAAIADGVLDEVMSGHVTSGTLGKNIADILVDTAEIGAAGAGLTEAGGTGDHLTAVPTMTTQMTESYNADGTAPTPAQALFVIMQMLTEMNISGTTMTVKKLDGSTTALTLTLNDASTPTSVTRAT